MPSISSKPRRVALLVVELSPWYNGGKFDELWLWANMISFRIYHTFLKAKIQFPKSKKKKLSMVQKYLLTMVTSSGVGSNLGNGGRGQCTQRIDHGLFYAILSSQKSQGVCKFWSISPCYPCLAGAASLSHEFRCTNEWVWLKMMNLMKPYPFGNQTCQWTMPQPDSFFSVKTLQFLAFPIAMFDCQIVTRMVYVGLPLPHKSK